MQITRWDPRKARRVLDRELERRAGGPGTSDTTLMRLSAMAEPEAHATRTGFDRALTRAGTGISRRGELAAEVARPSRWRVVLSSNFWRTAVDVGWPLASFVLFMAGAYIAAGVSSAFYAIVQVARIGDRRWSR